MNENLKLWSQVCETDPGTTKSVPKGKGFTITAIDAQSQIRKATEMFGPFGSMWGIKEEVFDFKELGSQVLLCYQATFFYGTPEFSGEFPCHSTLLVVKDTQYGVKVDDECYKKVATDALTKALSKIGFNADVFMGKFDDNRYVKSMEAKFRAEYEEQRKSDPPPVQQKKKWSTKAMAMFEAAVFIKDKKDRANLIKETLIELCPKWSDVKIEKITSDVLMNNLSDEEYDLVTKKLKEKADAAKGIK